jgi:hypothetical protein
MRVALGVIRWCQGGFFLSPYLQSRDFVGNVPPKPARLYVRRSMNVQAVISRTAQGKIMEHPNDRIVHSYFNDSCYLSLLLDTS